jgi:hypothetical protein
MIEIRKEDGFEGKKEAYFKMMEVCPELKDAYECTTFEVGQKLSLEIEVTDKYLSQILIAMLHPETGRVKGCENLGFKLNAINFYPDGRQRELIETLERFLAKLKGEVR